MSRSNYNQNYIYNAVWEDFGALSSGIFFVFVFFKTKDD